MELADLGRVRCRSRRVVFLWVLRALSNDARFPLGESFAVWNWDCVADSRSVPRVRPAAGLPREDCRIDLRNDWCACCRAFQLRNLLRPATSAGLSWRSTRWPKGA